MSRPWWSRPDLVAVAVLIAGGLGAWQATLVADRLGFGPGAAAPERSRRAARSSAVRPPGQGGDAAERREEPAWPVADHARPGGALESQPGQMPEADQRWLEPDWFPPEEETDRWSSAEWDHHLRTDAARKSARAPAERMQRFVQDLAYSPGLPEPRQSAIASPPPTWEPPVTAQEASPPEVELVQPGSAGAAGGATVVLHGRHLRASQVMFGATAARITRATADSVTVEVPPSRPGPVVIALTNDDGSFVVVPQPFSYVD